MAVKKEVKRWIIVSAVTAAVFAFIWLMVGNFAYLRNVPEQIEQVEVSGKRIKPARDSDDYPDYYVSFKFSDGSVKEFAAGRPNKKEYYNAINEGDTGKLTYKEKGGNRRFESFEKDPDYGGIKIEPYRRDDINEIIYSVIIGVVSVPVFVFVLRMISDKNTVNKSPERCAQVQVVNKRMRECSGEDSNTYHYYASFKFPDNSEKEFEIGIDYTNKGKWRTFGNIYDCMHKGDTGRLTYKESEEIVRKIKNANRHWFGRSFIRFEKDE